MEGRWKVIWNRIDCSPCLKKVCEIPGKDYDCLKGIQPEQVLQELEDLEVNKWCLLGLLLIFSTACKNVDLAPIYESRNTEKTHAVRALGPIYEDIKLENGMNECR